MRLLLDVNVLLARFDSAHTHHRVARAWLDRHRQDGWASCPLSENGFLRIISNPSYPNPLSLGAAAAILRAQTELPGHEFWADEISIADPAVFTQNRILGPNQITDVYLLALAVKNGGRFVTFDRGVPLAAVRGAETRHVVVL